MSKREWKPGDVAIATWRGGGKVLAVRDDTGCERGWWLPLGTDRYHDDADFAEVRPLVVIDPEDREQVERLAKAMHESDHIAPWHDLHNETRSQIEDATQAALREFANPTPPKPDEPMGLGAVVAAKCGCQPDDEVRFVRDPDARDFNLPWDATGVATGVEVPWVSRCGHHRYADLAAVRVLSEGVTP